MTATMPERSRPLAAHLGAAIASPFGRTAGKRIALFTLPVFVLSVVLGRGVGNAIEGALLIAALYVMLMLGYVAGSHES